MWENRARMLRETAAATDSLRLANLTYADVCDECATELLTVLAKARIDR